MEKHYIKNRKTKTVYFDYDKYNDVLYAVFGKNEKSIADEIREGVYLKRHYSSGKPVGFFIIDYKKRLNDSLLMNIPELDGIELPLLN